MDRKPARLTSAVLAWGDLRRRDLPWRRTRDPWAVLVSEVMLQQTQASRVAPAYVRFLDRFPDPPTCADAPAGEVVAAWHGLGYNRRAVNLHRAAAMVTHEHGGRMPDTLPGLLALPGVGAYTARAVLAFAFEAPVGVVDTNVARVLARRQGGPLRPSEVQAAADAAVPPGESWRWNQTMLDVGALVCRARSWSCGECPFAAVCAWRAAGNEPPDPAAGSAGVSRGQTPFHGSDRQGRGRLVAALRVGPVHREALAEVMGWPGDPERAARVAATVLADGLAGETAAGTLHLP